jgi:O-antigen/teichoic acid export membrane protein
MAIDSAAEQPMRIAAPLHDRAHVARNAFARGLGEVVSKAASLVFFAVMARSLGRDGFGSFMFALALTGVLVLASGFGTDDLTAREVARDPTRAGSYLADVATVKVISSIALVGVAAATVNVLDYSRDARLAVYVVGVGVAIEVLTKTWFAVFQAFGRLGLVASVLILQRVLTAVVGVAALEAGAGVVLVAFVYAGGALIGLAAAELFMRRLGVSRARIHPHGWPRLVRAGLPIGVAGLLFSLLLRMDVTLLSVIAGTSQVGLYAAAFRLVEGTQFVAWSFSAAMLPWLARARPEALARGFGLGLKVISAVLLPIGALLAVFAGTVIALVYGHEYDGGVRPLALLGLTCGFYGMQSLASTAFVARGAPWEFGRLLVPTIIGNVTANLILIPRYGAEGAAVSALASSVLLAALSVGFVQRRVGRIRLARAFGGPLMATGALVLVGTATPAPVGVRIALALAAYILVLAAFELAFFRGDAMLVLRASPVRLRRRHATS